MKNTEANTISIKKELKTYLNNIPNGKLRMLIGERICSAVEQYKIYLREYNVDYAQILESKYGKNILFEKSVFEGVILFLEEKLIKKIADANKISYSLLEEGREKILNRKFGYGNVEFSKSILDILELDQEIYLPSSIEIEDTFVPVLMPNSHLHKYQKNIKDKVIHSLLNPRYTDRMLIHMPTGSGKTKTAMEIVSDYLRCKSILGSFDQSCFIVWLAHSKELCDQAIETFSDTWRLRGDYQIDLFRIYGDHDYSEEILESEKAFVFLGFQKFNAMINSQVDLQKKIKRRILAKVKLVIVDEAHKSLARTYEKSIELLTRNAAGIQLIGLTATPGRTSDTGDNSNSHLAYFFNSTKFGLVDDLGQEIDNPIQYLQGLGVLAQIDRQELFPEAQIILNEKEIRDLKLYGDEKLSDILNDLAMNPARNKMIIDKIKELADNNESTLVFACNVEHCIILQTLLRGINIEAGVVLSSTAKIDRENSIKRFKNQELKILINYGVLTTGFDVPDLNALIIARPTTSIVLYSQMVGRILRGKLQRKNTRGSEINKLIDLRDNFGLGTENDMFNFYDQIWNY